MGVDLAHLLRFHNGCPWRLFRSLTKTKYENKKIENRLVRGANCKQKTGGSGALLFEKAALLLLFSFDFFLFSFFNFHFSFFLLFFVIFSIFDRKAFWREGGCLHCKSSVRLNQCVLLSPSLVFVDSWLCQCDSSVVVVVILSRDQVSKKPICLHCLVLLAAASFSCPWATQWAKFLHSLQ